MQVAPICKKRIKMFLTLGAIILASVIAGKLFFVVRKLLRERKEFRELFH